MTPREIAEFVVRMAVENPQWGYTRIRGALSNPRTRDCPEHGEADPGRPRNRPGSQADPAKSLEDVLVGSLGRPGGRRSLRRYLVFFVIELKSRRVNIAGFTRSRGEWMEQGTGD